MDNVTVNVQIAGLEYTLTSAGSPEQQWSTARCVS